MVCVRSYSYFLLFPFMVWAQDRNVKLVYSMSWYGTCWHGVLIFLPCLSFRYYTWANSLQSAFFYSRTFVIICNLFPLFVVSCRLHFEFKSAAIFSKGGGLGRRHSFVYLVCIERFVPVYRCSLYFTVKGMPIVPTSQLITYQT